MSVDGGSGGIILISAKGGWGGDASHFLAHPLVCEFGRLG